MIPTLGRIVHYTNLGDADGKYPPEQQAALITGVRRRDQFGPDCKEPEHEENRFDVTLHVFYKSGQFDLVAPFNPEYKRGCWTWAPKA